MCFLVLLDIVCFGLDIVCFVFWLVNWLDCGSCCLLLVFGLLVLEWCVDYLDVWLVLYCLVVCDYVWFLVLVL